MINPTSIAINRNICPVLAINVSSSISAICFLWTPRKYTFQPGLMLWQPPVTQPSPGERQLLLPFRYKAKRRRIVVFRATFVAICLSFRVMLPLLIIIFQILNSPGNVQSLRWGFVFGFQMQLFLFDVPPYEIADGRQPTVFSALHILLVAPIANRMKVINQIDLFKFRCRKLTFKL